jgi:hypothetical protein
MAPTTSAELLPPHPRRGRTFLGLPRRSRPHGPARRDSNRSYWYCRSGSRLSAASAGWLARSVAREVLVKYRVSQAYVEHLLHPWAGGWRCWLCPLWSESRAKNRCAAPVEVSLSYVPNSLRRRTIRRRRGAE